MSPFFPVLLAACQPTSTERPGHGVIPSDTATVTGDDTATVDTITGDGCAELHPAVRINELLSANVDGLTDADGDTPDWIELINLSKADVDLSGWSLSDDDDAWSLPATTLTPGGVLLILASGKESTDAELHADLTLAAEGETVRLIAPDDCAVDVVAPVRLYGDISYGRPAEHPADWEFFLSPTPGEANTTESRPGFAETPTLSPPPGFYDDPITVTVAGAAGQSLWITQDGAAPDGGSTRYDGPIALDAAAQPVVVRARASAEGLWPSRIATATYSQSPAILDDGLKVVSLTVDPFDLYDEDTGIYAFGDPADYIPQYPYFGANFWEDWERDLHIEVFEPDGSLALSQDAGVKIHGGYTRAFNQKNFRVIARSAYGPDSLDYPLFPSESLDDYKIIVLEGVGDWCPTHTENAFIDTLFRDADGVRFATIDTQAWEPAALYLNGEFWGLYALREKLDEHYIAAHHGVDADNIDRIECTADGSDDWWRVSQGDWEAFDALEAFVDTHDLSDPAAWEEFESMVDVDNLATTILAEGYWGNADWWANNLKLWRAREEGARWRWMVFDLGHGWTGYNYDHLGTSVNWSGKGLPIADALRSEAFRVLLANQASDLLNTSLSVEVALARFDAMHARIEPLIAEQYAKWCGQPESYWHTLVDNARTFVLKRTGILRTQVIVHLDLSGTAEVTLDVEPQGAGSFHLTLVDVEAPFTGTFFTGIPVTVTAVPAEGYAFAGWVEADLGTDPTAVVTLTEGRTLTAVFE